jgi:CIC family chloride channel protein
LYANLREIFDLEGSGRLILFSLLVGVVSGLAAAGFYALIELFQGYVLGEVVGYVPPPAGTEGASRALSLPQSWWLVLLVPTLGGLICGWIVFTFAPEAEGHGTDAVVKAFHRLTGNIRGRVPFVKAISSIITIGTGGSAGREGPIAQIGAGFGSFVGRRL